VVDEMKVEGNKTVFIHRVTSVSSRVVAWRRGSVPYEENATKA
jgi:hypothetical protein